MKTFSEFIAEARGGEHWWGSGRPAAQKKAAQLRTNRDPKKMVTNIKKGAAIQKAIKALDQKYEKDKPPETMDTITRNNGTQRKNTGYVTFRNTPVSSVGTQSRRDRRIVNLGTGETISNTSLPPGMTVSGAHNDDPKRRNRPSRTGGTYGVKG